MIRVLIVDDSKLIHTYLEKSLAPRGFLIAGHAYDGIEAVDVYSDTEPDVVIMDLLMPRRDGIAAIKEILKVDADARIVILTNLEREGLLSAALNAGARDYALKPCDPLRLEEALRRALTGRTPRGPVILSDAMADAAAAVLTRWPDLRPLALVGDASPRRDDRQAFEVPFSGGLNGVLDYDFQRELGRAILRIEDPSAASQEALVSDALGEVANLLTGRLARFFEGVFGGFRFQSPRPLPPNARRGQPQLRILTPSGDIELRTRMLSFDNTEAAS